MAGYPHIIMQRLRGRNLIQGFLSEQLILSLVLVLSLVLILVLILFHEQTLLPSLISAEL